ncbi:unnamed protein product [Caenorhabditis angaria]|uniref:7TM GPCR serpentine receptor class x (Srx) domain-containing protein n=1 Tax=Caenorhabditis angaria TaxID=860376 RepID=A0A9P1N9B8_9PELO|nr:unnamed protein product [Caenorhabditis angaria]
MLLKQFLGLLLFLTSFIGIILNIVIFHPIYQLSRNPNQSSIYTISFFIIASDILQLSITSFYLAPCIIFEKYFLSESNDNSEGFPVFLSTFYMICWYFGNISQISMVLNRFCVICCQNYTIFSRRNICIFSGITLVIAISKAVFLQFFSPCCRLVFDHIYLSYGYVIIEGIPNYTDITGLPLDIMTTSLAFICYTSVNIANLSLASFYLAPCIILESYLIGDWNEEGVPKFMGFLALLIWYIINITQIVMATNRYIVICYRNHKIFTHRNIYILFLITFIFSSAKAYIVQYLLPCCVFVFDYKIMSFNYARRPDIPNYSDLSDLPLNFSSTITAFFCYISIIYKIHRSNKAVIHIMSSTSLKMRKNREFTYAMQFTTIQGARRVRRETTRNLEWYTLVAFCVIINSAANAFIYLIYNREIIEMLKHRRGSLTYGSSMERNSNNF